MATPPSLRGIPLNTAQQTDANGFAPVYDPQAIRFGRKINFAVGIAIAIGLIYLFSLFFSNPEVAATETSDSVVTRMFFNFVIPVLFVIVGYTAILILTPLIGFDLPEAYSATAEALRAWLPLAAGEFPEPKENPIEELKESFATPEQSIRSLLEVDANSFLQDAAKGIAGQSMQRIDLISKDGLSSYLKLGSDGRYELIIS